LPAILPQCQALGLVAELVKYRRTPSNYSSNILHDGLLNKNRATALSLFCSDWGMRTPMSAFNCLRNIGIRKIYICHNILPEQLMEGSALSIPSAPADKKMANLSHFFDRNKEDL